jgi:hypothetical protein
VEYGLDAPRTRRQVLRAGGLLAVTGVAGTAAVRQRRAALTPRDARAVENALNTSQGRKFAARLAALGFARTHADRVRRVGVSDHVVYVGYARGDGARAVFTDLRGDPSAGGASVLETLRTGRARLSTLKLDPAGHVVQRQCALPYPIPGDADDPWRAELGLATARA